MNAPDPSPRIVSTHPLRRGSSRLVIELDDDSRLEVAAEVLATSDLSVGDPLDASDRARLLDADLRWRAKEVALRQLDVRARSRSELWRRLRKDRFPNDVIDDTLDHLESLGLVDDRAFAEAFVRDRLRLKPRGRRRIVSELREKGVPPGIAETVTDDIFDTQEVDEHELARDLAAAWLKRQSTAKRLALVDDDRNARFGAERRLRGYLARRGYGGASATQAVAYARSLVQDEA